MKMLVRRVVKVTVVLIGCISAADAQAPRSGVPTPASVIGFEPGTDRKLPSWKQVTDYFAALDAASPRVTVRTLGKSTLGRPFIAAFIADSTTLAQLPKYRDIQRKLADARLQGAVTRERAVATREPAAAAGADGPRGLARTVARASTSRERLIADGKVIVLVTSSIHSTEVGGILTPLVLAHWLASAEDAEAKAIRGQVITILVPSLNPDGVDIVADWYRSTLGTAWEGTGPPQLYHHYTGHDNNRDWYAFSQVETQLTVDSLHNVWHPQIVNDIHQQQSNGSRIFIPPYLDPVEPNVDPLLVAGVNQMGTSMAWRLIGAGKTGVVINASYDAWTPARAYQHYHGGIRILTETASAKLATPMDIPFDSLRPSRGYDPREPTWNFPAVWPGGRWTIRDIIDYQTSSTWALLAEAARDALTWRETFARVSERAVAGRDAPGREKWPIAFVIPQQQPDQAPLRTLLRILQRGGVEIRRATASFASGNVRYSAGAYVVLTAQPYAAFAKALLETQKYPDLREYPGGPPKRPYDVTAHTLPLLMGVGAAAISDSFPIPVTEPIPTVAPPQLVAEGLSGATKRRIGIYRSYAASMDEGWTRWIFDQYRIPYETLVNREVRAGRLSDRFDVIIIPDQSPRSLTHGVTGQYPDSLKGGLGDDEAAQLETFVKNGGTLVTFNEASIYAIEALKLPVKNVLQDVNPRDFYAPGSLLRLVLDRDHPIAKPMVAHAAAWFEDSPAFEITDASRATVVARYPTEDDPLLSGWLLGGSKLKDKAALVDVTLGKGHVVLFGFRPQYRAQSMAMYPMIWAAMRERGVGSGQ